MATDADVVLETERKFEVTASFTMPDLAGLPAVASVSPPRTHRLTAIYFDTPGQRLLRARVTLRRRTGGTDAGWHLKLPAGVETRREHHAPPGRSTSGVPAALAAKVAEISLGEPLRPVARLRTTRIVRELLDSSGHVLAEVADDRVKGAVPAAGESGPSGAEAPRPGGVEGRGWQQISAWREVEVELAAGSRDLLDAAGEQLCRAGARLSPSASKLATVLAAAPPPGDMPTATRQ